MFFPKMAPSQIHGQSLDIAASFIGVAMVQIGDAVFSGPLFRDGDAVYLLHADQQPDGKTVSLRFVDIGDRATTRVLEHTQHIAALTERVIADKQVIADLRTKCDNLLRENQELCNSGAASNARANSLDLSLTAINAERVELQNRVAMLEGQIQQYVDAVGPLDSRPSINDEIAEQMRLMEPEEINPAPQPVVEPRNSLYGKLDGPAEPGPAAYDAPGLVGETIARDGSVTDHAFRRLMFLTRGDDLL